jgi:glycine oxidase
MKIVIAGAGAAGLAIGWSLARAGATVEIVERGLAGHGATWASAGMLAPGAELGAADTALARFAHRARAAWNGFAADLRAASGTDIGFRENGSLIAARDAARAEVLQRNTGAGAQWLTTEEARAREPLLSPDLHGALFVPGDARVDNRALGEALAQTLRGLGATVRENCQVRSLLSADGRARGLLTSAGAIEGDAVVLACGAWMDLIPGAVLPPIAPVKGQMAAVTPPAGTALPKSLLWDEHLYLVPRVTRLIVGATVEDAGYDLSVKRETADDLLARAARIVPALRAWTLSEMWAGLRPRTPDDAPVLGETHLQGLYVAGGQFRNGILFTPLIAHAMRALLLGEHPAIDIAAFDPRRFA